MKGPILQTLINQSLFKTGLLLGPGGVSPRCLMAEGDFFLAVNQIVPLFFMAGLSVLTSKLNEIITLDVIKRSGGS